MFRPNSLAREVLDKYRHLLNARFTHLKDLLIGITDCSPRNRIVARFSQYVVCGQVRDGCIEGYLSLSEQGCVTGDVVEGCKP